MTEQNLKILNAVPLVDVMRGWGFVPKHYAKSSGSAWFLCPWHDDHHESLEVRTVPIKDATDLSFHCWACGEEGFGAIQLAARLMGMPSGKLSAEDLQQVLAELAMRCDVKLEDEGDGSKPWRDSLRVKVIGWDDFKSDEPQYAYLSDGEAAYERGEWTEEGLRALGLKVELASRRAKKGDITELRNNGITEAASRHDDTDPTPTPPLGREGSRGEHLKPANLKPETSTAATVRVGDMLTEFDPDSGEALYRCSFGKDFYRGPQRAETKTIREWGGEVERTFGVVPVKRFMKRQRLEKDPSGETAGRNDGVVVLCVRATRNYPIFVFPYPWGFKKYEPRATYGKTKWTWWNLSEDADLDHRWYADAALTDMLEGAVPEQDERHPHVEQTGKDGKPTGKVLFERVVLCSGPRDAMAVYSHSNAHVVWLHSEQSGFNNKGESLRPNRWLRSFLRKLQNATVDGGLYICYDEDATGLAASQAIALNSPNIHWLRLPRELSLTPGPSPKGEEETKPLKDVTDFVTHFAEVEGRMAADLQHDDPVEWFDNALFDTPTTKFWQYESARKEEDGSTRNRYKFDLRNTPVFLRARGMVRKVVQQGKISFSRFFLLGNNNTYTECFPGEKGANKLVSQARDLMAEWLRAHKEHNDEKGALSRAIYSAKLEQGTLESIEAMDFDDKSFGEDFDHFFFENCAVKVTKDGWETVPYNRLSWLTNSEAILDGTFTKLPQSWHVIVNPLYDDELLKHEDLLHSLNTPEERAQENMRWDEWISLWKYRLVINEPLEKMPMHFRFLYNISRIFWEKEHDGAELTKTERQIQDMYFIAMLHALGSALVRHRSANRQQFLHITDNGTRREDLASGGTGKTAILELLGLMRKVLKVDGKALEGGNISLTQELDKIIPGLHTIVALDELPQGFSPKTLYNYTLSLTSRGLYHQSVVLEGDDLPKFVIASNEQLDLSSDSTSRRTYQVLVSDWYHPRSMDGSRPAHTPADDFREQYGIKEVARNLPPQLLNEARNFLLGCTQFFLQLPDETLRPPRDSRALLRQSLAASKDEEFTRWIAGYLSDPRHLGQPIAYLELCISLLDFCGIVVGKKTIVAAQARIRNILISRPLSSRNLEMGP